VNHPKTQPSRRRRVQRHLALASTVAIAIALSGCGARYSASTRQALLTKALSGSTQESGQSIVGDGSTGGQPTISGGTANPLPTPGQTKLRGGSTPGGGVVSTSNPAAGNSTVVPPGGNGGATDVGVTGSSITVGTIADLSGPQPGLYESDIAGASAYFAYVNSQGGVFGRQIKDTAVDSQTSCQGTENAYSSLVPKVFAFVSGLGLYDQCGATVLQSHKDIPDFDYALTDQMQSLPNNYNFQPRVSGTQLGPLEYFKKKYPSATRVGVIYPDVPAAESLWKQEQGGLTHLGYQVAYTSAFSPTATDFTSQVLAMKKAGVSFVLLYGQMQTNATFINDAHQQGFKPAVINDPGVDYDPGFAKIVGDNGNGVYINQGLALYFNSSDSSIPGVSLYQTWMHRASPSATTNLYSVFGWAQAALFVQALEAAGPKVTRAKVLAAASSIHKFTADGLVAPANVGARAPVACYIMASYENGAWSRVDSPTFRCDAPYFRDSS
jgi:ABC-type branched-subunit amino acid transport system substrate-binding protein